jgi:putative PIN family toxin of toxin-antitoxin system
LRRDRRGDSDRQAGEKKRTGFLICCVQGSLRHQCRGVGPSVKPRHPALLLDLAFNKRVSLSLSAEIFDEYERVLRRPIFRIQPRQRESVLRQLRSLAHWTEPSERAEAARDPDDNPFLECALVGEVEFVITGNLRHFPRTFRGIREPRLREDRQGVQQSTEEITFVASSKRARMRLILSTWAAVSRR